MTSGNKNSQREGRLRIAYLSMDDINDRSSWSGTRYYMAQALEKYCGDVVPIGPLQPFSLKVGHAFQRGVRLLTGKRYMHFQTISLSKKLGKMVEKRMAGETCDVIFAPAGSGIIAHLHTQIPIVYLSDATLQLMINYYPEFSNVLESHVRDADYLERSAIAKAKQIIYPSVWVANSAVEDYGAERSRINIVPFGANLESAPSRTEVLDRAPGDRCRLLFVGVDWARKGGDIAFEALLELERMGVPAELTIVGCRPPQGLSHPHLHVFPFLKKSDPREQEQLNRLYREATFFILPTRAECYGIVACEANAYGLPVMSTQTGGVPDVVWEGVNGFLFPLQARGNQYAARIREIWENPAAYQALRVSSREQFETRLNWDAWGMRMKDIFWNAAAPNRTLDAPMKQDAEPIFPQAR